MKILLFGGAGQLGFELIKRATDLNFEIAAPVTSEVDISNTEQVNFFIERMRPDVIINAAAFTAVDRAETEKALAYTVNAQGPGVIADAVKRHGGFLIHISTDYVFDGELGRPISEEDPTNPINVYGASKLAGEQAIMSSLNDDFLIVRTASLHGKRGENFVHTMLKLFEERELVRVVNDQFMSPTWAGWLAETVLDLAKIKPNGIVHASGAGTANWFEFAQAIFELGTASDTTPGAAGGWRARLEPIPSAEFARPARRPRNSSFNTAKLATLIGRPALPWIEGLRGHLRDIGRIKE